MGGDVGAARPEAVGQPDPEQLGGCNQAQAGAHASVETVADEYREEAGDGSVFDLEVVVHERLAHAEVSIGEHAFEEAGIDDADHCLGRRVFSAYAHPPLALDELQAAVVDKAVENFVEDTFFHESDLTPPATRCCKCTINLGPWLPEVNNYDVGRVCRRASFPGRDNQFRPVMTELANARN